MGERRKPRTDGGERGGEVGGWKEGQIKKTEEGVGRVKGGGRKDKLRSGRR